MTVNTPIFREYLKTKFNTTKGNWDLFVPFIEFGVELNADRGIFAFIIPNKVLSANYTIDLKNYLSEKCILEIRDYSRLNIFKEANVYPVTLLIKKDEKRDEVMMTTMESKEVVGNTNYVNQRIFYKDILWDKYFFNKEIVEILTKLSSLSNLGNLEEFKIVGAATVNEAYLIKEKLHDNKDMLTCKRLINTGTIDKWTSLWGNKKTQYIKDSYHFPMILDSDIKNINPIRFVQAQSSKLIIAGMSNQIEAYLDLNGDYLAGKSTTIILSNLEDLKIYCALLNSKVASFFVNFNYHSLKMSGGYLNINNEIISSIPFPIFTESGRNKIIYIVNQILSIKKKNQSADISALEKEIDKLVYELYGLTAEKIRIIEEN